MSEHIDTMKKEILILSRGSTQGLGNTTFIAKKYTFIAI